MNPEQLSKKSKSNQNSDNGKNRVRPSLFPFRNSARRKSSPDAGTDDLFNPHSSSIGKDRNNHSGTKNSEKETEQNISGSEFEYISLTNSHDQGQKTPRQIPKDLIFDTPFVPLVHQSLSRTIWQSDEIIPEEKEDLDKKQSQTQYHSKFDDGALKTKSKDDTLLLEICNKLEISCKSDKVEEVKQKCGNIQFVQIPCTNQENMRECFTPQVDNVSRKFDYSHLICMSVPPMEKIQAEQQTFYANSTVCNKTQVYINGVAQKDQQTQTLIRQRTMSNKISVSARKSQKKQNYQQTESLLQKLSYISKNVDQEIGGSKKHSRSVYQQTFSKNNSRSISIQTQNLRNLNYQPQSIMQLMINSSENQVLKKKIDDFEELIRSLILLKNLQKQSGREVKSFGVQCDQKTISNKSSLKRVSIADTKIVFDLDSQSQSHKKPEEDSKQNLQDSKDRRKKKSRGKQVQMQKQESDEEYKQETKPANKRSKRKQGKTPLKKSKK